MSHRRRLKWHVRFVTYHIPHRISLEAKLLLEVEEYVFYLLLRKWDHAFGPPCGIGLTTTIVLSCAKVT